MKYARVAYSVCGYIGDRSLAHQKTHQQQAQKIRKLDDDDAFARLITFIHLCLCVDILYAVYDSVGRAELCAPLLQPYKTAYHHIIVAYHHK